MLTQNDYRYCTFELESIPYKEGDLLDRDLLVRGQNDGIYLLVLPQHPDKQLGQVCRPIKGSRLK
jgi:hypothetical protein